jgi:hypothetical protein
VLAFGAAVAGVFEYFGFFVVEVVVGRETAVVAAAAGLRDLIFYV